MAKGEVSGFEMSLCFESNSLARWGGLIPAARMIISEIPRFRVLVARKSASQYRMFRIANGRRAFVCTFLELTVVRGLLHKIKDGLGKGFIGNGPS